MPDDTKEHYFACNLLWWSLRVSFGRSELLQAGNLAERIEEYDDRLEELGAWLMDELVRVGRALLAGGESGVSLLNPPEIEHRVTRALKALEELAASAAATDEVRAYCVYLAECSWGGGDPARVRRLRAERGPRRRAGAIQQHRGRDP